jgi:hypothetical protein
MGTQFWLESLKGGGHSQDPKYRCKNNIQMDLGEAGFGVLI